MRPVEPTVRSEFRQIDLPLTALPSVAELRVTADSPEQKYEQARAKYLLDRLDGRDELADHYPYPVATWMLGNDVRFVFLGDEVVVDYALRIKGSAAAGQDSGRHSVWIAGYSNDVMAYIPSRRVLREGGYEGGGSNVYYGLPGLWSPEIEKVMCGKSTPRRVMTDMQTEPGEPEASTHLHRDAGRDSHGPPAELLGSHLTRAVADYRDRMSGT